MRLLVFFFVFSAIFEIRSWTGRRFTRLERVVKFRFFRFVGCVHSFFVNFFDLLDASLFYDVFLPEDA